MPAAFKRGAEKSLKAGNRRFIVNQTPAHHQNVRIIMLAAKPSCFYIMNQRGANPRMPVCGDRHPDPTAAKQNSPVGPTVGNRLNHLLGVVRIINGSLIAGSQIQYIRTVFKQNLCERTL